MSDNNPVEHDLLRAFAGTKLVVIKTCIKPTSSDDKHMVIDGRIDPEDEDGLDDEVDGVAFGLIYALALCSFADAVPAGNSEQYGFDPKDQFSAADLLRHLRFQRGELHLYVDYLRGRMVKTTIAVRRDGTFQIDTVNRGEAAPRWLERVQGKSVAKETPTQSNPAPPKVLN